MQVELHSMLGNLQPSMFVSCRDYIYKKGKKITNDSSALIN